MIKIDDNFIYIIIMYSLENVSKINFCVWYVYFFFSKGKKWKFVWKRQIFIAQYLSMGSQTSVDALYGYI